MADNRKPLAPIPPTLPLTPTLKATPPAAYDVHPIDDPAILEEIREWTRTILSRTGSGRVVIEIHFQERRYDGIQLGGSSGKVRRRR